MDLISSTESTDPVAELRLLRRQVQRERARRQAAENLGERATRDLYESVRQLRSAQSELLERADRTRVVNELARSLRQDHDTGRLVNRAAEAVGATISADRCDVLLVDPRPGTAAAGSWTSPSATSLPDPLTYAELPVRLKALLYGAGSRVVPVEIEDVSTDGRLDDGLRGGDRRPPRRARAGRGPRGRGQPADGLDGAPVADPSHLERARARHL